MPVQTVSNTVGRNPLNSSALAAALRRARMLRGQTTTGDPAVRPVTQPGQSTWDYANQRAQNINTPAPSIYGPPISEIIARPPQVGPNGSAYNVQGNQVHQSPISPELYGNNYDNINPDGTFGGGGGAGGAGAGGGISGAGVAAAQQFGAGGNTPGGANAGVDIFTNADEQTGKDLGDPNTGFAGSLAPGALNDILADPEQFMYEYLKYMGINPTDAVMGRFGNMGDIAQMISAISNPTLNLNDTSDDTTASLLNYMGNYVDNMSTVGGHVPQADDLIKNIFRAGRETPGEGGESDNALSELLAGGSDSDQIKNYASYIAASINTLSPMAQNAVIARLNRWGREWMSKKSHNMKDDQTFGEYVANKGGIWGAN
jgi:hypothetical protein